MGQRRRPSSRKLAKRMAMRQQISLMRISTLTVTLIGGRLLSREHCHGAEKARLEAWSEFE